MSHGSKNRTKGYRDTWKDAAAELKELFHKHTCSGCDHDEADGSLVNHCDGCCRKTVRGMNDLHLLWIARSKK